jgi:uncharacterized protein (TIGR02001 family)
MKMIKKISLLSLILVAFLQAEIGMEYYAGFYSHYMWRGYDLSEDKPLVAPGLTLSMGDNVWFDVWAGLNADYKEVDITAAYYLEVNDDFGVDLGLIAYTYPGMDEAELSYEPFMSIYNYSLPFEPVFLAAYDLVVETYYLELSGSQEILADSFPLKTSAGIGVYGWEGYTGISNFKLEVGKDFAVGNLTLTPSIQLNMVPQGFIDENADPSITSNEVVFYINISGGGEE